MSHMRLSIMLFLFACCGAITSFASQVRVTIHQHCPAGPVIIGGHDDSLTIRPNDSTYVFTFDIEEPHYLFIIADRKARYQERLWIDPRFPTRSITIDNCTRTLTLHDTIPLDLDDDPDNVLEAELRSLKLNIDTIQNRLARHKQQYIEQHPDSFLSAWYLARVMYRVDSQTTRDLLRLISPNCEKYPSYHEVDNYLRNLKYKSKPHIGDDFWEFTAQKPNGDKFDSRSISDKIIILDFWYAGCGPCLKTIEPLKKLYSKYSKYPLEIISFSADTKIDDWRKSCTQHNMPWISVSDLSSMNGPVPMHYGVDYYPTFIVFDSHKKINMITFGVEEVQLLEMRIKELLHLE